MVSKISWSQVKQEIEQAEKRQRDRFKIFKYALAITVNAINNFVNVIV